MEQEPPTIGLTINKYSTRTKLHYLACDRSEGKLSNPLVTTKGNLGLTSPNSLDQHQNHNSWFARCSPCYPGSNKQNTQFQVVLNKTFCPSPQPLSHQQLKHSQKKKN